jgi:hypothetical protein
MAGGTGAATSGLLALADRLNLAYEGSGALRPWQSGAPEEVNNEMMDSAIVFTFTRPALGRESKAFEAFTESMTFFGTEARAGKCGEPINFMGPSATNLMIVPGEYHKLADLVRTDEFLELYTKTVFAVPDIAYQIGAFGEGVQDFMARWARVGGELALL